MTKKNWINKKEWDFQKEFNKYRMGIDPYDNRNPPHIYFNEEWNEKE